MTLRKIYSAYNENQPKGTIMEDIMKVHVVKQDIDYARVAKENAIAAAVMLTISTIVPAVAVGLTKMAKKKYAARKELKKLLAENTNG